MRMDEMHGVPSEGTSMFLPHLHVYRLVLVFRGIHISIDEGLMRAPRKAFDVHAVAQVDTGGLFCPYMVAFAPRVSVYADVGAPTIQPDVGQLRWRVVLANPLQPERPQLYANHFPHAQPTRFVE